MPSFLESIRGAVGDTLFYYAVSPALKILVLLFLMVLPLIARKRLVARPNSSQRSNGGRELKYPAMPVERSKPV